jgi:long-subunit fatty acid transport protein
MVLGLIPEVAMAQVDAYHFTGINFNFANPGARARGIGGAFVALADDATAALANPAGLAYLDRQFSIEYAHDEERAPVGQITQGGVSVSGSPGSLIYTAENDPFRVWGESESDRIDFASFVFPMFSRKVGFSVYYASLADLGQDYDVGVGLYCNENGSPFTPNGGESCQQGTTFQTFYFPQSVMTKLTVDVIGAGFGWKLGDTFSIGGSVGYTDTSFSALSISDPSDWDPDVAEQRLLSEVDDSDVMYSLGLLYRGDVLGFGLSYRSETRFAIDNVFDHTGNDELDREFAGEFRIPERFSAGLAVFAGDHWVITGEYVHLPYSVMPEGMPTQFNEARQIFGVEYEMTDVDEYHLGLEYTAFSGNKGWSLRFGYWRDQSHLIYSSQGYNDPVQSLEDRVQAGAALLYREFDLTFDHFTAGIGAAFGYIRVDAAVDYSSDAGTDFLLSAILYF